MAAKKKASRKKGAKKGTRKKGPAKKRLTPRKEKRGLDATQVMLSVDSPEVASLVDDVRSKGGAAIGAYREPFSGRPMLLAALPIESVEPVEIKLSYRPILSDPLRV